MSPMSYAAWLGEVKDYLIGLAEIRGVTDPDELVSFFDEQYDFYLLSFD